MNFSKGTAAWCFDAIVRHGDLQAARELIKNDINNGVALKDKMRADKRLMAGGLFKMGTVRLGQTVLEGLKENFANTIRKVREKQAKEYDLYLALAAKAAEIIAQGTPPKSWGVKDLKIVVASLKRKGDLALPTRKADLFTRYKQTKDRVPLDDASTLLGPDDANNAAIVAAGDAMDEDGSASDESNIESLIEDDPATARICEDNEYQLVAV